MTRLSADERRRLIEQYRAGPAQVAAALHEIDDAELDRRPGPDGWTAREVVHHLADSEMTSGIRLRRLLAEESPAIDGYDEAEFARRLFYDRPVETSLQVLRAVRASAAELLERLSDEQWARAGTHSESGAYSVEDWLEIYAAHAHEHAQQMRDAATS